jgi:hypothetical protein
VEPGPAGLEKLHNSECEKHQSSDMNSPLDQSCTVILEQDPESDDLLMPIPEHWLTELGWKIGDTLTWHDNQDGTFTVSRPLPNPPDHG